MNFLQGFIMNGLKCFLYLKKRKKGESEKMNENDKKQRTRARVIALAYHTLTLEQLYTLREELNEVIKEKG